MQSKSVSVVPSKVEAELFDMRTKLEKIKGQLTTAKHKLALAAHREVFLAVANFFVRLPAQQAELEGETAQLELKSPLRHTTSEELIQAALAQIETLPKLADAPANLPAIGELFQRINVPMFFWFNRLMRAEIDGARGV